MCTTDLSKVQGKMAVRLRPDPCMVVHSFGRLAVQIDRGQAYLASYISAFDNMIMLCCKKGLPPAAMACILDR
jgi:hypothetical protein